MAGATIIKPDGSVEDVLPANGQNFSLEELQKAVGGLIEQVPGNRGIFCNEEGLMMGLSPNRWASLLTGVPLVGNVIICDTGTYE